MRIAPAGEKYTQFSSVFGRIAPRAAFSFLTATNSARTHFATFIQKDAFFHPPTMSYYLPRGQATPSEREWTRPFFNEKATKSAWGALDLHDETRLGAKAAILNAKLRSDFEYGTLDSPTRMWNTPTTSMVLGPYVLYQQGIVPKSSDAPVLPMVPADMRQAAPVEKSAPQFMYGAM